MENKIITNSKVLKEIPTFYFIGVTTNKSSIMKVFPLWMDILGKPEVKIEGIDLKIHDDPNVYREVVKQIRIDKNSLGGLVTTHKIDLYQASNHLFEYLDPYALTCGELSCISKNNNELQGHAKDPITAGLSLDGIIGKNYFGKTDAHVLCFGSGGSGLATALHLINKVEIGDKPKKFIFTNRSQSRLDHAKSMIQKQATEINFEFICNTDQKTNDRLMQNLPEGSIVINSTGMGKDIPGSPISWEGVFPKNGIAWEFNYRGELDFLHQAKAQEISQNLRIEDGWVYFLHGWTQVIAQVLHFDLNPDLFMKLDKAASQVRSQK